MPTNAVALFVLVAYLSLVLVPRSYWLLRGRACPHCRTGRLSFQGLLDHPWRTLRSVWQCSQCEATMQETRWGRLAPASVAPSRALTETTC